MADLRMWHVLQMLQAANRADIAVRQQAMVERRRQQRYEVIFDIEDWQFPDMYRLTKPEFTYLCDLLRERTLLRGSADVSLELKVLTALTFLGHGSYQKNVALSCKMAQTAVSKYLREVVTAINTPAVINNFIEFPTTAQSVQKVVLGFYRKYQFPGVRGAIDCTHVAIVRPAENEHAFFNRKHYHSLNVQMICDSDLRFLNVFPKFGGATHDQAIWGLSVVKPFMESLHRNGETGWLICDSGYPQRAYLMTPILGTVPGSREQMYTKLHVQTRNIVERSFGVLKGRFRCLLGQRVLYYDPEYVGEIVKACCVLHNMLIELRGEAAFQEDAPENNNVDEPNPMLDLPEDQVDQHELIVGRAVRARLVSRLFP